MVLRMSIRFPIQKSAQKRIFRYLYPISRPACSNVAPGYVRESSESSSLSRARFNRLAWLFSELLVAPRASASAPCKGFRGAPALATRTPLRGVSAGNPPASSPSWGAVRGVQALPFGCPHLGRHTSVPRPRAIRETECFVPRGPVTARIAPRWRPAMSTLVQLVHRGHCSSPSGEPKPCCP